MVPVGDLLQMAMLGSLQAHKELQPKWISVLGRIAGLGASGLLRFQSDYRFDLILRSLEDEEAVRLKLPPSNHLSFFADIQLALSRYWILSTYEMLRTAKASARGRGNEQMARIYRRFQLVRVPLTKLEIANDRYIKKPIYLKAQGEGPEALLSYASNQKSEYFPPTVVSYETGSLGWLVIDAELRCTELIFRRQLADELLGLFGDSR